MLSVACNCSSSGECSSSTPSTSTPVVAIVPFSAQIDSFSHLAAMMVTLTPGMINDTFVG